MLCKGTNIIFFINKTNIRKSFKPEQFLNSIREFGCNLLIYNGQIRKN